ncbi:MAG: mechanosensitive channel MscK, partial [Aeromonadaceae bacterium]
MTHSSHPNWLVRTTRCHPTLIGLIFSTLMSLSWFAAAAPVNVTLPDLPSTTSIQEQLNQLGKREALTVSEKAKREDLEKTLALLENIDKEKDKLKNQQKMLEAAPAKLQQYNAELDRLRKPADSEKLAKQLDQLPINQLDKRLTSAMGELQQAQEELAAASSQLTTLQTLPERVQVSMSQAFNRSQDIRNQLNGVSNKGELTNSQRHLLNAELAMLTLQLAQQQKDLDNNTTLQDLALKRQSLAGVQITQLEQEIQALQSRINAKRLNNSEKTAADVVSEASATENRNPLIDKELRINQQLSERLISATEQINQLVQENIKIKGWLERVTQTERNLNEQISMLKGSLLLSKILYQQRQMLPDSKVAIDLDEMIADLRLAQFDINQQRDQLFQRDAMLDKMLQGVPAGDQGSLRQELSDALDSRKELLDQLNKQLGSQLNLAINIKLNQQQLQRINSSLQFTLQQQIFWVSSNKPLDWAWFTGLPKALKSQFDAATISFHKEEWLKKTWPLLILIIPMVVLAILLRWKRRLLRDKVTKLSKDIGRLSKDSHLHTPKALLFTGLEVLPGALLIMAIGLLFLFSGLSDPKVIWFMSLRLTAAYMAFSMLLKILRPGGMAETHFGQAPAEVAHKYRSLKYVWRSLIPLIIVATLGELEPSRLATDAIGQLVTLTMLIVTLVLIYPIFRARMGQ